MVIQLQFASPVNAVSLLPVARAQTPDALKTSVRPPSGQASAALSFRGQFKSALDSRNDDPEYAQGRRASEREVANKKDPVPTIVVTPQVSLPSPPAAFGVPSTGTNPGQTPRVGPATMDSTDVSDDFSAESVVKQPMPSGASISQPEAELAFALRLTERAAEDPGQTPPMATQLTQGRQVPKTSPNSASPRLRR